MGKRIYIKSQPKNVQGLCERCRENLQRKVYSKPNLFRTLCKRCEKLLYEKRVRLERIYKGYKKYKKTSCVRCGFVAEDVCQLDIHHKDHNHSNNDPNNLETLCANCHRLHHFKQQTPA